MVIGLMLGFGVWQYDFPDAVPTTRAIANAELSLATTRLWPGSVRTWTTPTRATAWRLGDGDYLSVGRSTFQPPEPGAVLGVDSALPTGTDLQLQVDGRAVDRQSLRAGSQLLVSPPLGNLPEDAVVAVQLDIPTLRQLAPGTSLRGPLESVERAFHARRAGAATLPKPVRPASRCAGLRTAHPPFQ